ncbi:hypothetical protein SAMN05216189_101711 [Pseudomonas delhiensis]|uniref:Uncharacterized protein n=1 Tax=Pseudomonas delhiensis TaxID=366289 RepID=A0A239GQ84_9PSED|nr:hypothetical protein SAMN05216189_101711 [Pseudomonas delhiensis]SNS70244.1 hypothetical protein SAMN06295949_105232 [Pseudomonas delhiensis]
MNARTYRHSPLGEDGSLLFYLLAVAWLLCSGV